MSVCHNFNLHKNFSVTNRKHKSRYARIKYSLNSTVLTATSDVASGRDSRHQLHEPRVKDGRHERPWAMAVPVEARPAGAWLAYGTCVCRPHVLKTSMVRSRVTATGPTGLLLTRAPPPPPPRPSPPRRKRPKGSSRIARRPGWGPLARDTYLPRSPGRGRRSP